MDTIKLTPVAQEIYDMVLEAMQAAEELGGPEGAEYSALMSAIACEASHRALVGQEQDKDPDAYLQPLIDRFGQHKGLNADWCLMAWRVAGAEYFGDIWILDDESPDETVSMVRRVELEDNTEIHEIVSGSVETVLAHLDTIQKLKG